MGKGPVHFSKEDMQRAHKHMKGCSISLAIKEMQIKTTMRYYLTQARIAIINKSTNNKCWRGCGEKGNMCTVGGNAAGTASWKTAWNSSEN